MTKFCIRKHVPHIHCRVNAFGLLSKENFICIVRIVCHETFEHAIFEFPLVPWYYFTWMKRSKFRFQFIHIFLIPQKNSFKYDHQISPLFVALLDYIGIWRNDCYIIFQVGVLQNFSVSRLLPDLEGFVFGEFGLGEKVSVLEYLVLDKKYRFWKIRSLIKSHSLGFWNMVS